MIQAARLPAGHPISLDGQRLACPGNVEFRARRLLNETTELNSCRADDDGAGTERDDRRARPRLSCSGGIQQPRVVFRRLGAVATSQGSGPGWKTAAARRGFWRVGEATFGSPFQLACFFSAAPFRGTLRQNAAVSSAAGRHDPRKRPFLARRPTACGTVGSGFSAEFAGFRLEPARLTTWLPGRYDKNVEFGRIFRVLLSR